MPAQRTLEKTRCSFWPPCFPQITPASPACSCQTFKDNIIPFFLLCTTWQRGLAITFCYSRWPPYFLKMILILPACLWQTFINNIIPILLLPITWQRGLAITWCKRLFEDVHYAKKTREALSGISRAAIITWWVKGLTPSLNTEHWCLKSDLWVKVQRHKIYVVVTCGGHVSFIPE